jgi:magnesium chelatase family protein
MSHVSGIAFEKFNFSARSYDEILKVSRTIANLDSSDVIKTNHIEEVVRYRFFDRV